MKIIVLDRIEERHPEVTKEDAARAWASSVARMPDFSKGNPERYIGIGFDNKGREIEVVAVRKSIDTWVVIHAQTPAKVDIKRKLGLLGRKNERAR